MADLRLLAPGQARFMFIGQSYKVNKYCAAACTQCNPVRHTVYLFSFFSSLGWGESDHLVCRPLIGQLYQHRMIDDECAAVGAMVIGRGDRSTRRKHSPVPLCSPQIAHDLAQARTWAAAVGIPPVYETQRNEQLRSLRNVPRKG
jgi:hypothetical protein